MKTVKFYTLGCKVNQYDTQVLREQFLDYGFRELGSEGSADVCVINTCTVTHKADEESCYFIRRAKRENPQARIVVTGCLAQQDADTINALGSIDFVARHTQKDKALEFLTGEKKTAKTGITGFRGHTRAFLKIQDGCDNFCAYCKVPFVRGRSRSRTVDEIVREAKQLVKNGFKEIVLCGICLGAYGRDLAKRHDLVDVIGALEAIEGLLRLRLSSIEAGDVSARLIRKLASSKKACPHLHIPIQSGDDAILEQMNRSYRAQDYLDLIKRIKRAIPHIAITTDVLVGFPGEDAACFQKTVALIKRVRPLRVHAFAYSKREGTTASRLSQKEPSVSEVKQRMGYLAGIAQGCALAYTRRFLGKKLAVLIEQRCGAGTHFWQGHSGNYLMARVASRRDLQNQLVKVRLKGLEKDYIRAELC